MDMLLAQYPIETDELVPCKEVQIIVSIRALVNVCLMAVEALK
jgi:hypothetical protein